MSYILQKIRPEVMIGWMIAMSHISLSLVGLGPNITHTALFCRKDCKYVLRNKETHAFSSENTILNKENIGEGSHTVTVLEKLFSSHHKEVQKITYRQRTGKYLFPNVKGFKL